MPAFFLRRVFDWKRLAGAKVIEIDGLPVDKYINKIARMMSGNYLDHNIRVDSVVSSYGIDNTTWSRRLGDHASETFLKQIKLDFLLVPLESRSINLGRTMPHMSFSTFFLLPLSLAIILPLGHPSPFLPIRAVISQNYSWANNCATTNTTNGFVRTLSLRPEALGPTIAGFVLPFLVTSYQWRLS